MKRLSILIFLLITSVSLQNCGGISRFSAVVTGYSEECVNGVKYLQFSSGAALAVDTEGNPVTCD